METCFPILSPGKCITRIDVAPLKALAVATVSQLPSTFYTSPDSNFSSNSNSSFKSNSASMSEKATKRQIINFMLSVLGLAGNPGGK